MQVNSFARAGRRLITRGAISALCMLPYAVGAGQFSHAEQPGLQTQAKIYPLAEGSGARSIPIEGTWIVTVGPRTQGQGASFTALQSFTTGGVTLATGSADRTPPPPISPLYGSWKQVGPNRYIGTICFFVFDAQGNAVAMIKSKQSYQVLSNQQLTGSTSGLTCNVTGDNCVDNHLTGTITGKRLIAEGASE